MRERCRVLQSLVDEQGGTQLNSVLREKLIVINRMVVADITKFRMV